MQLPKLLYNTVMSTIASFAEAEALLKRYAPARLSRPVYTLEHMRRFMDFLGNPQDGLKVIHVAGTSGKTSTCYYVASLLQQAGKKVGLSVSPYIEKINERVQTNLVPLPEQQFCDELTVFVELAKRSDIQLSRFEFLDAFAYWEFARQRVDYVVMETGVGGTYDPTNVVDNRHKVCVITDIGFDHQMLLGDTLGEIAGNKAGIIGLHNKVFCYDQGDEVMAPIRERARQKQADLHIIDAEPDADIAFLPLFQQRNFTLAREVVAEVLHRDGTEQLNEGALKRAAGVHIPARMETFRIGDKTVILDGAHNAQKLQALKESLEAQFPDQPIAALVAFKADRHDRLEQSAAVLAGLANHLIVTSYGTPNKVEPYGEDPEIISALCKINGFWQLETIANPVHALRQLLARPEPVLLVTGSFYLFNDIRPLLTAR